MLFDFVSLKLVLILKSLRQQGNALAAVVRHIVSRGAFGKLGNVICMHIARNGEVQGCE